MACSLFSLLTLRQRACMMARTNTQEDSRWPKSAAPKIKPLPLSHR